MHSWCWWMPVPDNDTVLLLWLLSPSWPVWSVLFLLPLLHIWLTFPASVDNHIWIPQGLAFYKNGSYDYMTPIYEMFLLNIVYPFSSFGLFCIQMYFKIRLSSVTPKKRTCSFFLVCFNPGFLASVVLRSFSLPLSPLACSFGTYSGAWKFVNYLYFCINMT